MTKSDKIQLIVIWGLALLLGGGMVIAFMIYTSGGPKASANSLQFDHNTCQYPTRTTNPPDGCDNSDPCDPESAAKGGSGSCKDQADLPDPDRDYYDAEGNRYDYQGNLQEIAPAPIEQMEYAGK